MWILQLISAVILSALLVLFLPFFVLCRNQNSFLSSCFPMLICKLLVYDTPSVLLLVCFTCSAHGSLPSHSLIGDIFRPYCLLFVSVPTLLMVYIPYLHRLILLEKKSKKNGIICNAGRNYRRKDLPLVN